MTAEGPFLFYLGIIFPYDGYLQLHVSARQFAAENVRTDFVQRLVIDSGRQDNCAVRWIDGNDEGVAAYIVLPVFFKVGENPDLFDIGAVFTGVPNILRIENSNQVAVFVPRRVAPATPASDPRTIFFLLLFFLRQLGNEQDGLQSAADGRDGCRPLRCLGVLRNVQLDTGIQSGAPAGRHGQPGSTRGERPVDVAADKEGGDTAFRLEEIAAGRYYQVGLRFRLRLYRLFRVFFHLPGAADFGITALPVEDDDDFSAESADGHRRHAVGIVTGLVHDQGQVTAVMQGRHLALR